MMDPYQTLGVARSASEDEIKKAYRAASRKYHPDANLDDPKAAEAKFKEIQQAYQQIMKERTQGYSSNQSYGNQSYGGQGYGSQGYGSQGYSGQGTGNQYGDPFGDFWGNFGGFGQGYGSGQQTMKAETDDQDDPHMKAAANYINGGYYQEALNVLNDIHLRQAKWYFFSALANSGAGNNVIALQHIRQAVSMEPGNMKYQQLRQTLEGGGSWYEQQSTAYGRPDFSGGNFCLKLCMLNLMCNCCCGGGGMCCGNPYYR